MICCMKSGCINLVLTLTLALLLVLGTDSSVSVYALHPGLVNTDILRNHPWYLRYVIKPVWWLISKNCWYGAQTSIYCAVDDSIEMETGKYYRLVTSFTFIFENCTP